MTFATAGGNWPERSQWRGPANEAHAGRLRAGAHCAVLSRPTLKKVDAEKAHIPQ